MGNIVYGNTKKEGLNFARADSSQEQTLRAMEEAYKNGGDWIGLANSLGTSGNFVSAANAGGAPTGAYQSLSGASNGSMLWGLGGQMANTGVEEGTLLLAPDQTYWQVGAGGALTPYEAAIRAADQSAGDKPAAQGAVGGSAGSSYSASGSASSSRTSTPAEPSPYAAAISAFDYGPAPEWGGSDYQRRRDAALQRAEDMRFSYDPNTDPSWLAYQKQYRREGQRATADALGQAAAMTGGMPSSYAVTAASQAGDYYASQLSDRLPQLYQDAYNRYLQEYQRQLGIADAYAGYDQTEYSRYRDRLGQYNTDRNFAYGAYRDRVGDQRYADETAYARSRDAIGDERYETQWAQELREYEDKLAQQARENEFNERKYGDARHDAAVDEALAIAKYLGYVPEQYAGILGVPAGTQYYTLANASSGGGRSSGGSSSSGASTLGKKGFTEAQQAIINNDALTDYETLLAEAAMQGGSYDVGTAGTGRTSGSTNGSTNGSTAASSPGFDALAARLQAAYYNGADAADILRTIKANLERGQITDSEAETLLFRLGLDPAPQGSTGGRTVVNETK